MAELSGDQIYDLLEEMRNSTPTEAIELLSRHAEDKAVRTVFRNAFDPSIKFGLKPAMSNVNWCSDESAFDWEVEEDDFDLFAGRTMTRKEKRRHLKNVRGEWTEKSARLFTMVILKRLDCTIGITGVNKAIPGLIETFDVMLAKPLNENKLKFPMMVEPKYDGMRLIAVWDEGKMEGDGQYRFYTRQGNEIEVLDLLHKPLNQLSSALGARFTFDGEVVTGSFSDTISDVRKMKKQVKAACFRIFDILPEDFLVCGDNVDWHDLRRRRDILEVAFADNAYQDGDAKLALPPSYWVNSIEEIYTFYHAFLADGYEGAMVKNPDSHYQRKRSADWMKVKPKDTADLIVVGAFEGTGKYEGSLGGLIVDRNGVEVRVGGGFSDSDRDRIWDLFNKDAAASPGAEHKVVGKLIEVSYQEVTPDGSLRHPNFVRFRHDKAEVSF